MELETYNHYQITSVFHRNERITIFDQGELDWGLSLV